MANGQRVPEDWHRLSAHALVHRALRGGGSAACKLDAERREPGLRRAARAARRAARRRAPRARLTRRRPIAHDRFAIPRPAAAARPGRRPAPPVRRTPRVRFVPVVSNPHVAFGGVLLERLCSRVRRARRAHAGGRRRRARRRARRDGADRPGRVHRAAVAPGVLPGRARPAAALRRYARLDRRLPAGAGRRRAAVPTCVLVHASAADLCRLFAPRRASRADACARCCWPTTARPA